MFRGVAELSLDTKGRISVPTRYRDELLTSCEGHLVITVDTAEKCLVIYPLPEWETLQPKLDALSSINPMSARVKRQLLGNATDVDMDSSGRLLIPSKLRKHAMLDKKLVMIGQGKKFELWDEAHWDSRNHEWQQAILDSDTIPTDLESLPL
ncbi:MAG: division/cell wall cluster transcriptional repressor MraZ [Gammaproteobacteria bacterium]|nr:division/cell wall cluster transcriptional repressor MraZ [Gammaproteobacteria bacterium]